MPTILLKKSDTPGSVPGTANLTNLAGGVEVAVNTADKRVYSMTSASAVIELGTNPSSLTCSDVSATVLRSASATITNLIATSASITTLTNNPTFSAGTANGVLYLNGSKVATSGSALVFDGTNLGIGTSSPATLLDLGTSTGQKLSLYRNATIRYGFGIETDTLRYYVPTGASNAVHSFGAISTSDGTTYTERMRLTSSVLSTDSSINVGIGTASPVARLDVFKTSSDTISRTNAVGAFGDYVSLGAGLLLQQTLSSPYGFALQAANAANSVQFPLLLNPSGGNVGIGTASPSDILTLAGGASGSYGLTINNAKVGGGTKAIFQYDATNQIALVGGNTTNGLAFQTLTGGSLTSKVWLDTSGNLGIGTSSPSYKLDVAGDARSNSWIGRANGSAPTADCAVFRPADNSLGFSTANTLRATIDSSGNLGIGASPAASNLSGAYTSLLVKGNSTNKIGTVIAQSFGTTNATNIEMFASDGANEAGLLVKGASTAMTFYTGSAPDKRMTLDASGRLLVGHTSASTSLTRTIELTGASSAALDQPAYLCSANTGTTAAFTGYLNFIRSRGTTAGSKTVVVSGDRLGMVRFTGTDGSGDVPAAEIYAEVDGTAGVNDMPGRIVFATTADGASSSTERGRFTAGGYFKASNTGTYVNSTGTYHEVSNDVAASEVFIVNATNASYTGDALFVRVARNTTNNSYYPINYYNTGAAAYRFRVADSGNVTNTNGSYGTISDAKMKTDIVDAGSQWDDIKAVRFRKFKMKNDPTGLVQFGLVAQELEQVSPGLVDEHADRDAEGNDLGTTTKSVKTSVLLMKAAKALQEAMARIESLEADVAALKGAK